MEYTDFNGELLFESNQIEFEIGCWNWKFYEFSLYLTSIQQKISTVNTLQFYSN